MRFFAHDGKTTHGPAGIDELLKLPGFDGDTLICPVGSNDTADWKPAMAYPPFKKALLESVAAAPPPAAPTEPLFKPLDSPRGGSMLAPLGSAGAPIAPLPAISPMQPMQPLAAMQPLAPPPALVVKTTPCPSCKHANLTDAKFCNACGARVDGKIDPPKPVEPPKAIEPPKPVELPKPPEFKAFEIPVEAPKPAPVVPPLPPTPPPFELPKADENPFNRPAPAKDPFAHLDPMLSFPEEPAPMRRPLQPGKMGQLAEVEDTMPAPSAAPALAPDPVPAAAAVPVYKRPLVLAAFAGAAALAAGAAYMMLGKAPARVETVAELNPSAPAADAALPPVAETPAPAVYAPPPVTASPSMPAPRSPRVKKAPAKPAAVEPVPVAAAKPKRARKPRPARAPKPEAAAPLEEPGGGETMIESRAPDAPKAKAAKKGAKPAAAGQDPLLEALLSDATQAGETAAEEPAAAAPAKKIPAIGQRAAAAKTPEFSLPGLSRPVSASDRAISPPEETPAPADAQAPAAEPAPADPLAELDKPAPPAGIEDQPAKASEGDQLALMQVHEQFDFCAQLLSQGAFGDHFDTCLCKDAREASPYRGRRGFYVSAKKKDAGAGHLETTAKILTSKLDGSSAEVTARWKATGSDKGRTSTQTWKLEDGLWCQAP